MSDKDILFERELLFSINSDSEIGVINVELVNLKQNNKIIAAIRPKSDHDIFAFAGNILKILNSEMFSRINVNMLKSVDIIFIKGSEIKRVIFEDENSIKSYKLIDVEQSETEFFKQ